MNYYSEDLSEVKEALSTTEEGLSPEEAASRLERYGKNELAEKKKKSTNFDFFIISLY